MSEPLVEVVRSGLREGVHHGSVVLLDADGTVAHAVGDVDVPMFPRSSNKPMQALAMLLAGLDLPDDADLALACASHSGESEHVDRVLAMLAAAGVTEDDLRCPPDVPLHAPSARAVLAAGDGPRRVFMNCSGKHAAMLATCVARGWSLPDYLGPSHPLQLAIAATIADAAREPVAATAVDGCGAALYAVTLTGLARAFAGLPTAPVGSPERRVADAMRAHPFLVAGSDREDTRLMQAVPGLVCKAGAEGVHAVALPDGRALACKIDDGANRARLPVTVAALRALGVEAAELDALAEEPVLGGGAPVGTVRVIPGALPAA